MFIKATSGRFLINSLTMVALLSVTLLCGCIDFSGDRARKRDELANTAQSLKEEIARSRPLFDERDRLRSELSNVQAQIATLKARQKAMQE